jgi:hypothetical protein
MVLFTDVPGIQRHVQHHFRRRKAESASRRRHLRPEEAAKLIAAAGKRGRYSGRYPERDKLLLRRYRRWGDGGRSGALPAVAGGRSDCSDRVCWG